MNKSDFKFWSKLVKRCVNEYQTPFYLFTDYLLRDSLDSLSFPNANYKIRNWYSLKTHPVPQVLRQWKNFGCGVEVVSEYELKAALAEGFKVNDILVNGVAKHNWLKQYSIQNLKVHIDSLFEFESLSDNILTNNWEIGLRFNVQEEYDPDDPNFRTQFGLSKKEIESILINTKRLNIKIFGIHFHLRSNVSKVESYVWAIEDVIDLCKEYNIEPEYLDIGGGFPTRGERPINSDETEFNLVDFENQFKILNALPSLQEIWMENGRYITARSGVLVVKVLDIKNKSDSRYLICDSGRTNNSFVSDWEDHDFFFLPERKGNETLTTVCGSTCMAYDYFFRKRLSSNIKIGDYFIWMNAGAYHKSWETRFSNGLIKILYYSSESESLKLIRDKEDFNHWWNN
jgi:diaminopimelate decarboxylase